MCPDRKLKWFKDHGRTAVQIRDIKKMVIKRWEESYQGVEEETQGDETQQTKVRSKSVLAHVPQTAHSSPGHISASQNGLKTQWLHLVEQWTISHHTSQILSCILT
jgi:isochorismate hydrolase